MQDRFQTMAEMERTMILAAYRRSNRRSSQRRVARNRQDHDVPEASGDEARGLKCSLMQVCRMQGCKMPISLGARHVRLFRNGTSQAIRIPHEFELPGNEAILNRDEQRRLILESIPRRDLLGVLAFWKPLSKRDEIPKIDDLPVDPVEL